MLFSIFDSYSTDMTKNSFPDLLDTEIVFLTQSCVHDHIWQIVTKNRFHASIYGKCVSSRQPLHSNHIAMHRSTIFMPTVVIGQGTEILV